MILRGGAYRAKTDADPADGVSFWVIEVSKELMSILSHLSQEKITHERKLAFPKED
jgi:hypothetical protein